MSDYQGRVVLDQDSTRGQGRTELELDHSSRRTPLRHPIVELRLDA